MFCSQCGKKVLDSMLFCPFCGSEIVIPAQEQHTAQAANASLPKHAPNEPVQNTAVDESVEADNYADHLIWPQNNETDAPEPEKSIARTIVDIPLQTDLNGSRHSAQIDHSAEDLRQAQSAESMQRASNRFRIFDEDAEQAGLELGETPIDPEPEPEVPFEPLDVEAFVQRRSPEATRTSARPQKPSAPAKAVKQPLNMHRDEPLQLQHRVPNLNKDKPLSAKAGNTANYVPLKSFNANDIFLDGGYDAPIEDDDYEYEDAEEGSFLSRHIRGLVGLGLLLVLLAVFTGWAISDAGQTTLAKANLAWKPSVYQKLGYLSHQEGNYLLSGSYYEKAFSRSPTSYSNAFSAAIAYSDAGEKVKSFTMLKKAIAIDPTSIEAYQLLMILYPDASTRPWDVTVLIRQGYQLTGDESLKIDA